MYRYFTEPKSMLSVCKLPDSQALRSSSIPLLFSPYPAPIPTPDAASLHVNLVPNLTDFRQIPPNPFTDISLGLRNPCKPEMSESDSELHVGM